MNLFSFFHGQNHNGKTMEIAEILVPSGQITYRVKYGKCWAPGCDWLDSKDDAYGIAELAKNGLGIENVEVIEAELVIPID